MKSENQEKIFKILEPVVEFLKENGVDAKPSIYRINYGAIKINGMNDTIYRELQLFLQDNKEVQIFTTECDEKLGNYIIFSFVIDGKWSHAWE